MMIRHVGGQTIVTLSSSGFHLLKMDHHHVPVYLSWVIITFPSTNMGHHHVPIYQYLPWVIFSFPSTYHGLSGSHLLTMGYQVPIYIVLTMGHHQIHIYIPWVIIRFPSTYHGSSSGSHPSSSLRHTKHLTRSGSLSVGQWKKPARAS